MASPSEGVYIFDLDVRASAEEFFGHKSGTYEMVDHVIIDTMISC